MLTSLLMSLALSTTPATIDAESQHIDQQQSEIENVARRRGSRIAEEYIEERTARRRGSRIADEYTEERTARRRGSRITDEYTEERTARRRGSRI